MKLPERRSRELKLPERGEVLDIQMGVHIPGNNLGKKDELACLSRCAEKKLTHRIHTSICNPRRIE